MKPVSTTAVGELLVASRIDVHINAIAVKVVTRVSRLSAPDAPKNVLPPPPKVAPASAPLPC